MKNKNLVEIVDTVNRICVQIDSKLQQAKPTENVKLALQKMKKSISQFNELPQICKKPIKISKAQDNANLSDQQNQYPSNVGTEQKIIIKEQQIVDQQSEKNKFLRGPYRQYSEQLKKKVTNLHNRGIPFNIISKMLDIPCKNIIRWCRNGVQRKPGAGRKVLDPVMEQTLSQWLTENFQQKTAISSDVIRTKARQLSNIQGFSASLGWLKNFMKRFEIKQKFYIY